VLSRRLDALWRYDQYIANAEGYESVQAFWRKVKEQEKENIVELKKLLSEHIRLGDF
jgi:rubrerythrin